jgi:hypothetical protein
VHVFGLSIFLGAFLLFQVQPLMAKFILPWFGGGPGVWTICMLFFQICLLAGYGYAHALSRVTSRRTQAAVHAALLVAALIFLPIGPGANWKPEAGTNPTWGILVLLTACLGLPYFMLASTGPLLQAWVSQLRPRVAPYRFYALSNTGSLLALVSYPCLFEPLLTRRAQANIWSWSFGMYVLLCGACAWRLWQARSSNGSSPLKAAAPTTSASEETAPKASAKIWWFGLPACGSILLLATTNKLCLDVAAIPFLWILPLSLYLLTFIICFDRPRWYGRNPFTIALVPLLGALCYVLSRGPNVSLWWQTGVLSGCLLWGCMICHGEVYRLKPAPRFLTSFYLYIAAGGAAGGIFVGLVAPLVFHSYAELSWGFWLLAALVWCVHLRDRTVLQWKNRCLPVSPVLLLGVAALGVTFLLQARSAARDAISMSRNFYGVLRVSERAVDTPFHAYKLNNGAISHGLQFANPLRSCLATTYYNEASGVGLVLTHFQRPGGRRVGVVGLGAGTLAAYGQPGDTFRFYEINPEVCRLAETGFSFLRNSSARIEVVAGDARLNLERECDQQFDVLVLDAFSSDAIPVHLLTLEAFETYFRHLRPDGIIAVHISNHHLNLLPVLAGVTKHFDRLMMCLDYNEKGRPWWFSTSRWVLVTRNGRFLLSESFISHASLIPERFGEHPTIWTDDYASLLSVLNAFTR